MTEEHRAEQDPEGLALRCSCGSWAMLFRNALGLNATHEHRHHAAYERVVAERDEARTLVERLVVRAEGAEAALLRADPAFADLDRLRSDLNQATAVLQDPSRIIHVVKYHLHHHWDAADRPADRPYQQVWFCGVEAFLNDDETQARAAIEAHAVAFLGEWLRQQLALRSGQTEGTTPA